MSLNDLGAPVPPPAAALALALALTGPDALNCEFRGELPLGELPPLGDWVLEPVEEVGELGLGAEEGAEEEVAVSAGTL